MLKGLGTPPGVIHTLMFKYSRDTNRFLTHTQIYFIMKQWQRVMTNC